MMFKMARSLRM